MPRCPGSHDGAAILGLHLEGPFIDITKKGAHPEQYIRPFSNGFADLEACYGDLSNVAYITLAPEQPNSLAVVQGLRAKGIRVAIGHTKADIKVGTSESRGGTGRI